MVTVHIAGFLTDFTGGRREMALDPAPATVDEVLATLWHRHVGLRDRVVNERGQVRPHVNIFVNNDNIRHRQALQTVVTDGDEITILPAISGGASRT
jgi:MoaD family protein